MSIKQIQNSISQLNQNIDNGHLSLFEEFDTIKQILKQFDAKHARTYYKQFLDDARVTYSPRRQIYFAGKQNRKGSGKALRLRDMPKIATAFQNFIGKKLDK